MSRGEERETPAERRKRLLKESEDLVAFWKRTGRTREELEAMFAHMLGVMDGTIKPAKPNLIVWHATVSASTNLVARLQEGDTPTWNHAPMELISHIEGGNFTVDDVHYEHDEGP